jgi:c-di-GMP-binding flagellar brake protein YcgR
VTSSWDGVTRTERQHRRYAHEAAITLIAPGVTLSGRTRDVSHGGLCATLPEQLDVGIDLEVDIQLVFEDERQSEALRLAARIVWCTAVDDGYQIGVRFLRLTGETSEYLTMFLRYLAEDVSGKAATASSVDERFG